MITEDYVSFETAKLLKKKGFDEGCSFVVSTISKGVMPVSWPTTNSEIEDEKASLIALPSLQMAMKWLRKEHNLAISTSVTIDGWRSYVSQIKLDGEGFVVDIIDGIDDGNIPNSDTYEQACEAAIKYCLEKLI